MPATPSAGRASVPAQGRWETASPAQPAAAAGIIGAVGPGDTLTIDILGQQGGQAQGTVDADGKVVVPLLGAVPVAGLTPAAIGRKVAEGLRSQGFMRDPQVSVEVVTVRSRVVSVLGQVERPGRYPLDSRLSVLELLAIAGGSTNTAGDTAVLIRGNDSERRRIQLYVGNRQSPSQAIQDTDLQPGDVVFVPQAPRFYISGAVSAAGAYPVEQGLTVMRAVALAGGLTPRASDSRIDINRTDVLTGAVTKKRVELTDSVQAGDVIVVNERIF